jgi:hypothetical protein
MEDKIEKIVLSWNTKEMVQALGLILLFCRVGGADHDKSFKLFEDLWNNPMFDKLNDERKKTEKTI